MKTKTMTINNQVNALAARYKGRITPNLVVAEARKCPNTPLGKHFKFSDVSGAAESWWLHQARELIRTVQITVVVDKESYRIAKFHRDPSTPTHEQGYVSTLVLRNEPINAIIAASQELEKAEAHLRKAEIFATVLGVKQKRATAQARRSVERAQALVSSPS